MLFSIIALCLYVGVFVSADGSPPVSLSPNEFGILTAQVIGECEARLSSVELSLTVDDVRTISNSRQQVPSEWMLSGSSFDLHFEDWVLRREAPGNHDRVWQGKATARIRVPFNSYSNPLTSTMSSPNRSDDLETRAVLVSLWSRSHRTFFKEDYHLLARRLAVLKVRPSAFQGPNDPTPDLTLYWKCPDGSSRKTWRSFVWALVTITGLTASFSSYYTKRMARSPPTMTSKDLPPPKLQSQGRKNEIRVQEAEICSLRHRSHGRIEVDTADTTTNEETTSTFMGLVPISKQNLQTQQISSTLGYEVSSTVPNKKAKRTESDFLTASTSDKTPFMVHNTYEGPPYLEARSQNHCFIQSEDNYIQIESPLYSEKENSHDTIEIRRRKLIQSGIRCSVQGGMARAKVGISSSRHSTRKVSHGGAMDKNLKSTEKEAKKRESHILAARQEGFIKKAKTKPRLKRQRPRPPISREESTEPYNKTPNHTTDLTNGMPSSRSRKKRRPFVSSKIVPCWSPSQDLQSASMNFMSDGPWN